MAKGLMQPEGCILGRSACLPVLIMSAFQHCMPWVVFQKTAHTSVLLRNMAAASVCTGASPQRSMKNPECLQSTHQEHAHDKLADSQ